MLISLYVLLRKNGQIGDVKLPKLSCLCMYIMHIYLFLHNVESVSKFKKAHLKWNLITFKIQLKITEIQINFYDSKKSFLLEKEGLSAEQTNLFEI